MPYWGEIEFNTAYDKYQEGGIGSEWNSGELVQILVTDGDMNFDARTKDQMKVKSNTTIVPAIKIGSPITLASLDTVKIFNDDAAPTTLDQSISSTQCSSDYAANGNDGSYTSCYEKYSERAIITEEDGAQTLDAGDAFLFTYDSSKATVNDLKDLIANANGTSAYTYINYDLRSLNGGKDDVNYYLNFTVGDNDIMSGGLNEAKTFTGSDFTTESVTVGCTGLVNSCLINSPAMKMRFSPAAGTLDTSDSLNVLVTIQNPNSATLDTISAGTSYPMTMDFVTFGQSNDGVQPVSYTHLTLPTTPYV